MARDRAVFACSKEDRSTVGLPRREIVNGIFYVMRSGCPWRQLPKDLPPWRTVCRWSAAWRDACAFEKINNVLVMLDRERVGREGSPFSRDH